MNQIPYPFITRKLTKDEGGGYLVEFPDLPGCIADGDTIKKAIDEAQDAVESYIQTCILNGDPIPRPSITENFSGQWRIRVPKSLHAALALKAKAEGVSLNTLATTLLAMGITKDLSATHIKKEKKVY